MASILFDLLLELGYGRGKHYSTTTTQDTNIQLLSQVQGFDKTVCAVVEKGGKRRLNCEYIQCNKHREPYHTHTWYKTNGRNHILEYETHKDAAALKCVCCLIRHNRCRGFIRSTCIYHDYTNSLF
jgi:hypothetical protein